MLPFLKNKQQSGVIVQERPSDHKDEDSNPEDNQGLIACAEDIIDAIKSGNARKLAAALTAAHEICDSYEHAEGPHSSEAPSPHTFEAQNKKAAE